LPFHHASSPCIINWMTTVPIDTESSPGVVMELLFSLRVKDAMTSSVVTATTASTVRKVQCLMKQHAITAVPILEGERLLGIVSIGDVIQALDAGAMERPVSEIMTSSVVVLDENMPLSFAVTYFDRYKYGRFPVLSADGRLKGIITASDVLRRLLIALNEEIGRMERRIAGRQPPNDGPLPTMELSFGTVPMDFSRAGNISARFKRALTEKGCPPAVARNVAVASYELELNQVIHSTGGIMRMRVFDDIIEVFAQDEGPGIPDLELAMREGYSTANEWVRSLGFGAGIHRLLPNLAWDPETFGDQAVVDQAEGLLELHSTYLGAALEANFEELAIKAANAGALVIPAHVDRAMFSVQSQLGFLPPGPYDAVESIFAPGAHLTNGHSVVSGSDAHYPEHIGRRPFGIDLPREPVENLKEALKIYAKLNVFMGAGGSSSPGGTASKRSQNNDLTEIAALGTKKFGGYEELLAQPLVTTYPSEAAKRFFKELRIALRAGRVLPTFARRA